MEKLPKWMRGGYLALFALLPWSVECSFGAWRMNLPSEPLIAVLGVGLVGFVLKTPGAVRALFSRHFLLKISLAWVGWLAISTCFSTMPLVSWKYWVVEAGHWWVFAVGMAVFPSLWPQAFRLFAFSMAGMVIYTLTHHSFFHFRADQALLAPMPFFPENTLYAAVLAMVVFRGKGGRGEILLTSVFLTGLLFSFCRAAWVSVFLAGIVGLLVIFKQKRWLLALVGGLSLVVVFAFGEQIFDGAAHKIAQGVSTRERLNRYACAWRMVQERPWAGFGPGTFQFRYLPFQKPEEMTRISARAPVLERGPDTYGRGGGAHSEFFQALADTGWPGWAIWLALTVAVLWVAFKNVFWEKTEENQRVALGLALGLLTFFLHGLVNNMLHDGRVAALVWGMVVMVGIRKNLPATAK